MLILVLVLLSVILLISSHKIAQLILTSKTSATLQAQLFTAVDAENQLLEAELKVKKNPEEYLLSTIGFVPDHLEYGCKEGVQVFKVSVPPLESFIAIRMNTPQVFELWDQSNAFTKVGEQSLSLLVAVDLHQSGTVDRLYAVDQDYIWSVDLIDTNKDRRPYPLAEAKQVSHLRVLPDAKGNGVRLYFLGEHAQKKGLFMIQDPLKRGALSEVTLIVPGDYCALFVRFGRLLLISKDPAREPEVLDLPSYQPVAIVWQSRFLNNAPVVGERTRATLLWDPKEQVEILSILNTSSQLTFLAARTHEDKMQRVAWRKIKK